MKLIWDTTDFVTIFYVFQISLEKYSGTSGTLSIKWLGEDGVTESPVFTINFWGSSLKTGTTFSTEFYTDDVGIPSYVEMSKSF